LICLIFAASFFAGHHCFIAIIAITPLIIHSAISSIPLPYDVFTLLFIDAAISHFAIFAATLLPADFRHFIHFHHAPPRIRERSNAIDALYLMLSPSAMRAARRMPVTDCRFDYRRRRHATPPPPLSFFIFALLATPRRCCRHIFAAIFAICFLPLFHFAIDAASMPSAAIAYFTPFRR
jgi:hypothetical protein